MHVNKTAQKHNLNVHSAWYYFMNFVVDDANEKNLVADT